MIKQHVRSAPVWSDTTNNWTGMFDFMGACKTTTGCGAGGTAFVRAGQV